MTGFLDTNILIYALTFDRRTQRAEAVLCASPNFAVQSLNEFALTARRKLAWDWARTEAALEALLSLCPEPQPLTTEVHQKGVAIAQRYRLNIYDSMIVAAALTAGCDTLWSEDLHHGLVVEDRLTIRNPFRD